MAKRVGEILPPSDFFDCRVLSLPFFLDAVSSRTALWFKRRVYAQGWSFWELDQWVNI